MIKKTLVGALSCSLLAGSMLLFGCSVDDEEPSPAEAEERQSADQLAAEQQAAEEPESDYTISDEALVDNGYGSYSITGTFTNTCGKELSYVQVQYRILDADGAQIGTAWANTSNLPDGSAWKFDAMYFGADGAPAAFELADVSSF